jgi:hypothetical protein
MELQPMERIMRVQLRGVLRNLILTLETNILILNIREAMIRKASKKTFRFLDLMLEVQ